MLSVSASADPDPATVGGPVTFTADVDDETAPVAYTWSIGGATYTTASPVITFWTAGDYDIYVGVIDADHRYAEDRFTLTVGEPDELEVTSFTSDPTPKNSGTTPKGIYSDTEPVFEAEATGGVEPYRFVMGYAGFTNAVGTLAESPWTPPLPGRGTYAAWLYVQGADGGDYVGPETLGDYKVYDHLTSVEITPDLTTLVVGDDMDVFAAAYEGIPDLTYDWSVEPPTAGHFTGSGATITFVADDDGDCVISCEVTDGGDPPDVLSGDSETITITLPPPPPPGVACSTATSATANTPATFTATAAEMWFTCTAISTGTNAGTTTLLKGGFAALQPGDFTDITVYDACGGSIVGGPSTLSSFSFDTVSATAYKIKLTGLTVSATDYSITMSN